MNAAELKQQIENGEYQVDPVAVADAMLRRLRGLPERNAQKECSNPDSSPSASVNTTPGGPSTTKPTHVGRSRGCAARARSRASPPCAPARRRTTRSPRRRSRRTLAGRRRVVRRPRRRRRRAAARRATARSDAAAAGEMAGVGGQPVGQIDHRPRAGLRKRAARAQNAASDARTARAERAARWRRAGRRPRPSSTASPAPAAPSVPVTATRSPGRAPSRPTSSPGSCRPSDDRERHGQRGGAGHVAAGDRDRRVAMASRRAPRTSATALRVGCPAGRPSAR